MDVLLDQLDLADVVLEQLAHDVVRLLAQLGQQLVVVGEAARDQLGLRGAVVGERRDDDQHAVLRHVPAVAQRDVRDVADADPVDERDAGLDVIGDAHAARESSTTSPFSAITIELAGTPASCASRACAACIRYSPWIGIIAFGRISDEQRTQLLGACVARDVHVGVLLVQHLCAVLRQPVDRVVDAQLVARHRTRRDDHRVAALDLDRRMVVVRDARERRQRLALRAGAEDQLLVRRDVVEVGGLDEHVLRHVDVAEVARDVHVAAHRPADDDDLAAVSTATSIACCMRWMFDAKLETSTRPLRGGMIWRNASPTTRSERVKPGALCVRRVAEQQVDAAVAELGEPADVGLQPVDRRVVELPVAGVEDAAGRSSRSRSRRVGHRVRHADELDPERAEVDRRRPPDPPRAARRRAEARARRAST